MNTKQLTPLEKELIELDRQADKYQNSVINLLHALRDLTAGIERIRK